MNPIPVDPADAGKDLVLVFTDMESSSTLWESKGVKFYSILQAHMGLVREACQKNGGFAVKSTGDGYFIVFERPDAALQFALDSQIGFSERPDLPRARIGIDIGEVYEVPERGDSVDYVGSPVNRAARICALAGPSTVLVSERTARAARRLPAGAKFESIGSHSLRNVGLEELYVLRHELLGDDYPRARANVLVLPWVGDLFVGRDDALDSIVAWLRRSDIRCVSIIGLGGMGKTRLSLEAARRVMEEIPDGIAFVELDGIRDTDVAWSILAASLRSLGYEGDPKPQDIGAFFAGKTILLILDGVEGLKQAEDLIINLLSRAKSLRLLVSSRSRLKIPSAIVSLDSLPLADAEKLLRSRMEMTEPDAVPPEGDTAVTELCRRLDCIPLSIELAAARSGLMTPAQMLARIESRFSWMTDSHAPETGHRRSLEATIGWSYDLLSAPGQAALMAASLFPTGFRLDGWERLMGAESLDSLGELQRSSLISTETRADQLGKVFFLLETIRLYASDRLRADPAFRKDLVTRFASDMLGQAQRGIAMCRTPAEASAFRLLNELVPNLQTALAELIDLGRNEDAASMCEVLAAFNHYSGRNKQSREVALKGLALEDESPETDMPTRAGLLRWLASASLDLGDAPSAAHSAYSLLELAAGLPSGAREREQSRARNLVGLAFTTSVEPKSAIKEFETALALAEQIRDRSLEGMVRHNMGWLAFSQGNLEAAAGHLEAARVLRERLGDLRGIAETSSNMGLLEQERKNLAVAVPLHFRSLECWSSVQDMEGIGKALFNLAECFELMNLIEEARAYYAASLVMFERSESQYTEHANQSLIRVEDSGGIQKELAAIEPSEIAEWLSKRFGTVDGLI